MIRLFQTILGFVLILPLLVATPVKAGVAIAPHRAVYDLSLKNATDRSGISGINGRMVIELNGNSCEGWTINFRMINRYLLQRGLTRLADNRSSSWESGDGLRMHFTQRQFIDNKLQEESRIKVGRDKLGEPGAGSMSKPKEEKFNLASDVVFPMQHQVRLVEAALAGESRERSVVYDGSEGAKAYIAVSFIGAEKVITDQQGKGADALKGQKAWPVSISYFDQSGEQTGEVTPAYQVSFRMFENGVAGDLVLDYGDFAIKGVLANYEALEQVACD
ncbi:MAG: cell envelope integrity EipB family protein [Aestuariivirgaceae bacterium]